MALPKKPGIAIEIGAKPPRPPMGMKDAPMPPDDPADQVDQGDGDESDDADISARLTKIEDLLNKIADAVGVDQGDDQPAAAPDMPPGPPTQQ